MFPEGENYHTLLERMNAGVAAALRDRSDQHVLVVGHGGIFTFTLKDICGDVDLHTLNAQPSRNCSITEIEVQEVAGQLRGTLKAWASIEHLSGEAVSGLIGHPVFDARSTAIPEE